MLSASLLSHCSHWGARFVRNIRSSEIPFDDVNQ
jgi:hypothetical protein